RRDTPPVVLAAFAQEVVQHHQAFAAPAALPPRGITVAQAQVTSGREHGEVIGAAHRMDARGNRYRRLRHERVAPALPAIAFAQATNHPELRPFAPGHAMGAAPGCHRPVARKGPAVA
ncbi:hypothetical protein RZS08_57270, partial [Arthrospira platensis SPKY1]|nr:hypothetical protein [Arthrospira platensis SPKY1]